jgi:hypothetical protein
LAEKYALYSCWACDSGSLEISLNFLSVSGCAARYVLVEADAVLTAVARLLAEHLGVASGSALAIGIAIAADAKPTRPPANIP